MYHTGIRSGFSASHTLIGVGADEREHHAHTYRVDWIVSVEQLDELGFGVDIDLLTAELQQLTRMLDGMHLNDLPFFVNDGSPRQPSVENLARHMCERLDVALRGRGYDTSRLAASRIELWESDTAWAGYSTDRR